MYRPHLAPAPRQGIILLVVLAMLTLFTIIGISFALYANAAATQARLAREAEVKFKPDMEPEECLSLFLDQLIFDVRDDESGVYSGLRGHSLSRSMYGFDYNFVPATATNPAQITQVGNDVPFIGVGRLHYQSTTGLKDSNGQTIDDYKLINYTYFSGDPSPFLRDPERYDKRAGLPPGGADNRKAYIASANVPYTYPDLNNFWLGAIDGAGNLITPSFHREWLFGPLDQTNPNWTNSVGKYLTTRPRPADHNNAAGNPTGFPYPGDRYGDVKNLVGFPGGNDSSWLDIGAPVLTTPDGRKYKMLVAPLIVELDGRVNLNVHGNKRSILMPPGQASDHGFGPWEVGLAPVLPANDSAGQPEWKHLFNGRTQPTLWGRYGPSGAPLATTRNPAPTFLPIHSWSQLNVDASPTSRVSLPTGTASTFPTFPTGYDNSGSGELTTNPMLYDAFAPYTPQTAAGNVYNRRFAASNMERLCRWQDTGYEGLRSELEQLLPANFGILKFRNLVTTDSYDRDAPGISPYLYSSTVPVMTSTGPPTWQTPTTANYPPMPPPAPPVLTPAKGEFTSDWRSALAATSGQKLTRLDLNLPILNGTTPTALTRYWKSQASPPQSLPSSTRLDTNATATDYMNALKDRQAFALQIYKRLLAVAELPLVAAPASPTDTELQPRRWLAQIAVNMVDFMDNDDISTPFNFYTATDAGNNATGFDISATTPLSSANPAVVGPRYWVFGTELPRVVINEVMAEYTIPQPVNGMTQTVGTTFDNKVWVELFCPMDKTVNGTPPIFHANLDPNDQLAVNLGMPALPAGQQTSAGIPANPNAYAAYQVVVADQIILQPANNNVLGLPLTVRGQTSNPDFAPGALRNITNNNQLSTTALPTIGGPLPASSYLLLTPPGVLDAHKTIADHATIATGSVPAGTPYLASPALQYQSKFTTGTTYTPNDTSTGLTVLLQRLANPHIPPNNDPKSIWYNPYLTIDYIQNVPLNDSTKMPYSSVGKKQPYTSRMNASGIGTAPQPDATSLVVNQTPNGGGSVTHTFGAANNPLDGSFDWLFQPDRVLINPLELLHVSQFQPHQLTQQFMLADASTDPTKRFQHAPLSTWYDETHRLYRVFEFFKTRNLLSGYTFNGRTTGAININAIWDYETFLALCDPQSTNNFTASDVKAAWDKLIQLRSPNVDAAGHHLVGPTSLTLTQVAAGATARLADKPFQGFGTGAQAANGAPYNQFPEAQGINDTLLRSITGNNVPTDQRLFEITQASAGTDHPYIKAQLMTKIMGNVTTRSNVFAVWTTVGFFEVTDDTKRPVQLGAEMGAAEGKAIRHRMFAIVDRSVLPQNPNPSFVAAVPNSGVKLPFRPSAPPTTILDANGKPILDTSGKPLSLNGLVPHWSLID